MFPWLEGLSVSNCSQYGKALAMAGHLKIVSPNYRRLKNRR